MQPVKQFKADLAKLCNDGPLDDLSLDRSVRAVRADRPEQVGTRWGVSLVVTGLVPDGRDVQPLLHILCSKALEELQAQIKLLGHVHLLASSEPSADLHVLEKWPCNAGCVL